MTNFKDTAIVRKLRRRMCNVPKGALMFVSASDHQRLTDAYVNQGLLPADCTGWIHHNLFHRTIAIERRKK